MTQEKNTDLTPEEQAQIAEKLPTLLQAIESKSPIAAAWLAQWRSKCSLGEEAAGQAEAIQQEVAAVPSEQGSLAQWCGFPTDMTRCSPFFPMNPKELGHREYLEDFVITSANWGEIKYTGPKLSTYEEDVLMVLLATLEQQSPYRKQSYAYEAATKDNGFGSYDSELHVYGEDLPGARKTLTYKGPILPLLRLLGIERPGQTNYKRLLAALKRMTVAGVELSIATGKTKSGKRRAPRITQMAAMLAGVYWDDKKKELTATINPFFYETYMAGRVTLLDVVKRMNIKGVIAKALYRFIQSQRQNPVFVGHFLTLADALNMDRDQPAKEIRRKLKTSIGELVRQGVLKKRSGFVDVDILNLERAPAALPSVEKKKV